MDKIIAVDFDGTMCVNKWPEIGEANEEVLNYIKAEKENGAKLILWTNRSGEALESAVIWSKAHGIEFDAVNDNLQESIDYFGENSRKIYATELIDDRASRKFRLPYAGPECTSVSGWAKREIDIACHRENPEWKPGTFDYGCSIYQSAYKAFLSLIEDGHSGCSFGFVKQILTRLMNHLPLTPIEDTEDVWGYAFEDEDKGYKAYQCTRMPSLFKSVYKDGHITYSDNDRYICQDAVETTNQWTGGVGSLVLNEMFPIRMPYYPSANKYKVIMAEYSYDPENGNFDLVKVWRIIDPNGNSKLINRYFARNDDGHGFHEIDWEEFHELKKP